MGLRSFLIWFLFAPLSVANETCRKVEQEVFHSRAIPVPIGMTQDQFGQLLEIFRSNSAFASTEGMAIYGSRTHFSYGYPPREKSDLDVALFGSNPNAINYLEVLNAFAPLRATLPWNSSPPSKHGNEVLNVLPHGPILEDLKPSENSFLHSPLTPEQERDVFVQTEKQAKAESWDSEKLSRETKRRFDSLHATAISREAIFILRARTATNDLMDRLRSQGFNHIIVLPE